MSIDKKSYQDVMKATTLFGGVQIVHILITIGRSKIIALLIGAEGMGIAALFLAPLRLITNATSLGLGQSAVREIAVNTNGISDKTPNRVISILNRVTWVTAVVGAILMIIFSPWLSDWSFKSDAYVVSFIWLGIALVFNQLSASRLAVLQGMRKLDFLAKSNLYGAICGLIVTIPLYYFFGIDGVLPAIIGTSGFIFLFAQWYYRKLELALPKVSFKKALAEGKPMMTLGITLSISGFIGILVAYLVQIFISHQSGEIAVGYYSAGIVILNTYVGLIFKAMSSDYFPRLSAVCDSLKEVSKTVYEQAFVAVLLITPIIVIFIAFASPLMTLLYSSEFDPSVYLIKWGILGMLFKAASWSVGYVIIVKGDSNLFIKTTIAFNALLLALNIIGYNLAGLEGIGISLLCYFFIHFIAVQIIVFSRYNFVMARSFYPVFILCLLLCFGAFCLSFLQDIYMKYGLLLGIISVSLWYSYRKLDQKVGFKSLISAILKKGTNE